MNILVSSFRQSLKSLPFVFKTVHLYFGVYYIAFSALFLFSLSYFFPSEADVFLSYIGQTLGFLAGGALVFIVPYYTYKKNLKGSDIRSFWTFIRETFWPVIWNLYIKATLVIILFAFLLIIPGLYKAVRLSFVNETIFFDNLYKQRQISALKGSDKTSQGYFWPVCLAIIVTTGLGLFVEYLAPFLIKQYLPVPLFVNQILILVLSFYFTFFAGLFYAQFYFELKKQRGEDISC